MLITSLEGTIYQNINISTIKTHLNNKSLFAKIAFDRKINYKQINMGNKVINGEFINDLTKDELNKGLIEIENICKLNNELGLIKEYYKVFFKDDDTSLLSKLKELKLFEVNSKYNTQIDTDLKEYVPNSEMLTWSIQEMESRAFKQSDYQDESLCPFMKIISTIRNYPLNDLCDKAILKADSYREAVATLIGLRQALQDKIEKTKTVEDLEKIDLNDKKLKRAKEKLNGKN